MFGYHQTSNFDHRLDARRSKPLQIWGQSVQNGHIKRLTDDDIQSSVLEIAGTNVSTTYITCPKQTKKNGKKIKSKKKNTLGIKLPFLVMIIKNVSVTSCRLVCYLMWILVLF